MSARDINSGIQIPPEDLEVVEWLKKHAVQSPNRTVFLVGVRCEVTWNEARAQTLDGLKELVKSRLELVIDS